jgi:hypothetical protein
VINSIDHLECEVRNPDMQTLKLMGLTTGCSQIGTAASIFDQALTDCAG